jgi:RNA polymerase sigma-70 factor (ECF subfamily)
METGSDEYGRLIGPIENKMIRSIWRIVDDPHDAEDALQEALAAIWKDLKRIKEHPNPQALILRMCANAAYDALRRRRRHAAVSLAADIEDASASPAESALGAERRAEILEAVRQLSRKQAVAVMMRDLEDMSYQDISQTLGCSEPTARTHVARARTRLATLLPHLLEHRPKKENRREGLDRRELRDAFSSERELR